MLHNIKLVIFIINDQYLFKLPDCPFSIISTRILNMIKRGIFFRNHRHSYCKLCPAKFTGNCNISAMFMYNTVIQAETKTGSLTNFLTCVEWIEYLANSFPGYFRPIIYNIKIDFIILTIGYNFYYPAIPLFFIKRIAGIINYIDKDLFNLSFICKDHWQGIFKIKFQ